MTILTDKDNKDILAVMQGGVFLQTLLLMINFCIRCNKVETLQKLKEILDKFPETLSEEEKAEFQGQIDTLMDNKAQQLVDELNKTFTPQESQEIVNQITTPLK